MWLLDDLLITVMSLLLSLYMYKEDNKILSIIWLINAVIRISEVMIKFIEETYIIL